MKHFTEKTILSLGIIALLHLLLSSAFAKPENLKLVDRNEVEILFNSDDFDTRFFSARQGAIAKLSFYVNSGRKDPWIMDMLKHALNDSRPYVVKDALEVLKNTNDPSAADAVMELQERELPDSIKDLAIKVHREIQVNQEINKLMNSLDIEIDESVIENKARRMIHLFEPNAIVDYFHGILNKKIKSEADGDRYTAIINTIATSENKSLKNRFLPDFLRLASQSNSTVSALRFFDLDQTYSTLLSIIGDKNIDLSSIRSDAIKSLFYNLPKEIYFETVKKIEELIEGDEYLEICLEDAQEYWKNKYESDRNEREKEEEEFEEIAKSTSDIRGRLEEKKREIEGEKGLGKSENGETRNLSMCSDNTEASQKIETTARDVEAIARLVESKDNSLTVQKSEIISKMHSEAKEIERRLRNALERFEIDTQLYGVAIEPIEKEIIRLQNEINGHFPGTLKRAATEVAEVFGYNEFGTHESRRREIEKKKFEIRKKEQEILDPVIEELKNTYNEGVQFFNAYRSSEEKSFSHNLNEWELLQKSREMLSEFSKIQQKQNHN